MNARTNEDKYLLVTLDAMERAIGRSKMRHGSKIRRATFAECVPFQMLLLRGWINVDPIGEEALWLVMTKAGWREWRLWRNTSDVELERDRTFAPESDADPEC